LANVVSTRADCGRATTGAYVVTVKVGAVLVGGAATADGN